MSLIDLKWWAYPSYKGWSRETVRPPITPIEMLWELLHRRRIYHSNGVGPIDRLGFHSLWVIQRLSYNIGWLRGLSGKR